MKFEKTKREEYVEMGYKKEEEIAKMGYKKEEEIATDVLEMHFIELPKFIKKNAEA